MKRKSPSKHKVKKHIRDGKPVRSHTRGKGQKQSSSFTTTRIIEKWEETLKRKILSISAKISIPPSHRYGRTCLIRSAEVWEKLHDKLENMNIVEGLFDGDNHTWLTFTKNGKKYIIDPAQPSEQRATSIFIGSAADKRYKSEYVVDMPEDYKDFAWGW